MYKGSSQTCYKLELRNRILKAAMTEFLHKGVKSVKMDDIANTLAISKRTLYEIYSNKEELLLEAVRIHEQEFNDHMLQYSLDKNHNVMDIIIEFYKKKLLAIADVSPLFLVELRKYKQVVEHLEKQNAERHNNALLFFHRGVKEGFSAPTSTSTLSLKQVLRLPTMLWRRRCTRTTALLPSCTTLYSFICAASAQRKA